MAALGLVAGFLLLCLAVKVESASLPTVPDCNGKAEFFKGGQSYTYKYKSVVEGAAVGTTDKVTGVNVDCDVELIAVGQCRYILKTSQCTLGESTGASGSFRPHARSGDFGQKMSQNPVSFLMTNGEVRNLIVSESEPIFILNIKRGIISTLQGNKKAATKDEEEIMHTDVHGTCLLKYTASQNHIETHRDLDECHYPSRHDWTLSPASVLWNMTFIQIWFMNSSSHCSYDLSADALTKVTCDERHAVRLESSDYTKNGVQTTIHTSLEFRDKRPDSSQFDRNLRNKEVTGIQYVWEPEPEPTNVPRDFESKALKLIKDIATTASLEVRPLTITLFDELVHLLRTSSDVMRVTERVYGSLFPEGSIEEEISRALTRDAVVTCNTVACMKAVRYLAVNDHLSNNYFNRMLYRLTKLRITNPAYIDEILGICKEKPTRMCLLSLTSVIYTYQHANKDITPTETAPAARATVQFLSKMIGNNCNPRQVMQDLSHHQRVERIILVLKSFGNLGDVAAKESQSLLKTLQNCATNKHLPKNATLEAIKAFRRITPNDQVNNFLKTTLSDQKLPVEHRIAAYLVLVDHNDNVQLFEDIAEILKKEKNHQLGNFITMHMRNVQTYGDAGLETLKTSMRSAMADHEDVFVVKGTRPLTSSRHREFAAFFNSPYLRDIVSRFGIDISSKALYETFSYIPREVVLNLTSTLFGKTFNTATLSATLAGLEPFAEALLGPQGVLRSKTAVNKLVEAIKEEGIGAIQQRLLDPVAYLHEEWTPHFDNAIEDRLTKIHNSVINEYKSAHPSATFSLKLYGNELAFTSLDLIRDRILSFVENDVAKINWEEPHTYRAHRVVRFIEGNYQVPTGTGLPIYFGTEADLALSIRASAKADIFGLLQEPRFLNAEWDLNPSFAVTFLNRMVVKVSDYTQFGFQANNTAFRSRQRSGSLTFEDGDLTLVVKAPTRPQQVINLFRTNQYIRGDNIEDIPDSNINRVSTDSCYPSSYTGVKFCRVKSYADVTYDETKPWALLAGNAEYRAYFEMDDKGLTEYTLHLKRTNDETIKQYEIEFKAPGTKWRREINGFYKRNKQTNEISIDIKVPEKPHFRFHGERKLRGDDDYVTHIDAQFLPDRPVTFHAERKHEEEKRKGAKQGSVDVKVIEAELKLPERTYTWSRTLRDFGQKKELNHLFTFESKTPDSYMQRILPDMFWENNRKAKIQLHSVIELQSGVGWGRTTSNYVKLPKSILQVETERISSAPERRALHFNITKRSLPDYNIQSFLNFTYDMSSNPIDGGASTRRIHEVRLYIPHVRWGLDIARDMNRVDNKITAVLRRDKARDNRLEVKDLTNTDVWDVTFTLHHHNVSAARGDIYPTPRERTLEFSLVYPREGTPQKLSYKGKIINDEGQRNAIRSFKTDSTIDSTYWNIHWKANTDYLRSHEKIYFDHNSAITSLRTQKTATYKAHLDAVYGLPIDFTQNFQSSFYTFDEKLKVRKNDGTGQVDLNLEIVANSPVWDGLNVNLKQDVQLDPRSMSTETMHFTHKLVDIDVKAEFKLPFGKHYKKEFNIKSKNSVLPSMRWIMDHHDNRYYSVRVEYPDDPEGRKIYGVLEIEPSLKGATLKVTHDTKTHANETALLYSLALVTPDLAVVKYDVDEKALATVANVYAERFAKTWDAWTAIKNDPEHPMNKLLRPIVKTTLGDFQRELRERIAQRRLAIRKAISEAIESLEPIYGPTLTILRNILGAGERLVLFTESDRPQTFTGWAFDYFNARERIRNYLIRLFDRLSTRAGSLRTTSSDGSVAINHGLHWNSLVELPRVTPAFYRKVNAYQTGTRIQKPDLEMNRVGIVYGGHHVYTFDGKSYTHPGFVNKDCVFILAHDFVFRHYSVLLQENAVHLLFPELAVSVDKQGNVKINGSKTTSEVPISSYNKHVTVRILHDHSVHVHSDYGLDADILPESGTAIFYLDFWNHNRTLGLLGNNDNEPLNDFKLLNGKITEDVFEFIAPYEVSGRSVCSDRSRLDKPKPCTLMGIIDCEVFDSRHRSSLYPCFDVVDPAPFSMACSSDPNCRTGKACDSIVAYAAACKAAKVHVRIPKNCAGCEHGHSWTVDGEKSAEVVVVVQDNEKNSQRVKGIEGLLDKLERTFKQDGYTSVKYGLVTYHHDEPYAHTLKGKLFAPLKDVVEGLKSISFTSDEHHSCALDSLHLAAEAYPFSPSSAHIVLLSTSKDMESSGLFGNRDVSKVHRQLEANGITMYTFAEYDDIPRNKKVFGVRGDGYVFPQPKKGDGYSNYPSGMYAKLTSGTRGALFHAGYLTDSDNKFFTEVSKEILTKVNKEVGHCKHCTCHSDDVIFSHSVCHPSDC